LYYTSNCVDIPGLNGRVFRSPSDVHVFTMNVYAPDTKGLRGRRSVSSYSALLLVRFSFGVGEAGAYPNASALIARWIPVAKRTRAAFSPLLVVPIQVR
jgi:MFS family permease